MADDDDGGGRLPVVHRVDFGYFVRPATETGTGAARVDPCLGYLVEHADGLLLVDTGMGSDPEADAHYRPRRRPLKEALAAAGFEVGEVGLVANCHLHFDHCGGNPELAGRPIFTQRIELATARSAENYTLPQLIEAPGLRYEELDGEAEVLDGVVIVPTPGHTAGHQSVVVHRPDGTVVVAGQTHDTASGFSGDALAWRARREARREGRATPLPVPPEWMDRLRQMDPRRVLFAHDHSVWEP